ncbi:MAG: glycosyltransferase, partial [Ferruginibacter sp.]
MKPNKKHLHALHRVIMGASSVVTFSDTDQWNIQTHLAVAAAKIKLLKLQPFYTEVLKWTEKELVKIEFAKGMEYFVFAGDLDERFDLLTLLKAFSLFKKWQQSNMQLVIVGNKTSVTSPLSEKLASFKYRDDVHLLVNQTTAKVQRIIAGAYAFVYPVLYEYFPITILQAMQAEVPV